MQRRSPGMRMTLPVIGLLATLAAAVQVQAQQIIAEPVGKAPPGTMPGGGIQEDVYNRTSEKQQLRVRAPGGNWYLLDIPPHGGRNPRCASCGSHFEATLPDDDDASLLFLPGTEYEIRREGRGQVLVQSRVGAGPRR